MPKMKKRYQKPEFWISSIGLAGLVTAFLCWLCNSGAASMAGRISAFLSAALFAAVCLRFVPEWMQFWRKTPNANVKWKAARLLEDVPPKHVEWRIFLSLLLVDAFVVLLVFLLRRAMGYAESFCKDLSFWTCTDSGHYLDIARDWYLSEGPWERLVQLVFLPGYPLTVRLLNTIVNNVLYAGMLVSAFSFAGAGCIIYRLLRLDSPHSDAIRTIKYFCLLPGSFFFVAPMSESLFLLLCAACIYCARTKKWVRGCLFGAMASFTRSLGLTLFVPLFFELVSNFVRERGEVKSKAFLKRFMLQFAALFLVPIGFAAYCYINYIVAGDPFKFMEYQSVHWSQHLGWFFNTACYQLEMAIKCYGTNTHNLLGLWIPNLAASFLSLVIMLFAVKQLRPSYSAWYLSYFIIAIGATWLLSAPRYLIALIPVPLAVAKLTKKPMLDMAASLISLLLSLLYLNAFVMRWQVW